jgi:hypothetical protein
MRSKDAEQWKQAMAVELQNMDRLGVWDSVEKGGLPKETKTVGSRWVFTTKRQAEGTKFKARLVARGDQELPNTDDTYSPTASMSLVRTVFSLVATWGLQLAHWDVTTAFLNAELGTTPVYMRPPQGMDGTVLLKLKKAIYGLRRSPRRWHEKVKPVIQALGLKQSNVEPCLFYKITQTSVFLLVLFVDDFKVAYHNDDLEFFRQVRNKMFATFKMNDVEDSRFVGVEFKTMDDGGIVLHQERYLSASLEEAGFGDVTPRSTPMQVGVKLPVYEEEQKQKHPGWYRSALGMVRWLNHTRPDISFTTGLLERHGQNPGEEHETALRRMLRYLSGTKDLGIHYRGVKKKEAKIRLQVYSDSDLRQNINNMDYQRPE